jgi:hypothetical protein
MVSDATESSRIVEILIVVGVVVIISVVVFVKKQAVWQNPNRLLRG